jgi:hypothetical protein
LTTRYWLTKLARQQVQDVGAEVSEPLVVLPARLQIALSGMEAQGGIPIRDGLGECPVQGEFA